MLVVGFRGQSSPSGADGRVFVFDGGMVMVMVCLGATTMGEDSEGGDADTYETAGGFGGTVKWLASCGGRSGCTMHNALCLPPK